MTQQKIRGTNSDALNGRRGSKGLEAEDQPILLNTLELKQAVLHPNHADPFYTQW